VSLLLWEVNPGLASVEGSAGVDAIEHGDEIVQTQPTMKEKKKVKVLTVE